jgi:hypothetical protein
MENLTMITRTFARKHLSGMLALGLAISFSPYLPAQIDTGRVEGTVKDQTGAVVPGAKVSLRNNDTGVVQTITSAPSGNYLFEAVKPGTYTLNVQGTGFQNFTALNIVAHVQQNLTEDVTLAPGEVSSTVTVTSAAPLLQAEDASIGQTITGQEVNDLPLAQRNWVSLAQLSAGVTTTAGGTTGSALFVTNGINFWQNDIRLDGIDNNEEIYGGTTFNTNAAFTPPPDAIQEFKLQTGDFNAEFGHSTGSVLNAVLKSGTNRIHGDLWEYNRNTAYNASDYFAKQTPGYRRPAYHQNQFGGTIGGPVWIPKVYNGHDKTFFFFDYQGTRIVTPSPITAYVPTLAQRNSNFTNFQDYIALAGGTAPRVDALGRKIPLGTFLDPATTRTVAAGAVDPVSQLQNTSAGSIIVRDPFYSHGSIANITDFTTAEQYLNQLPANRLDPNAVKLMGLFPTPTPGFETNRQNYRAFPKSSNNINQYDIRIDENFSPKDILFGVFDLSHTVETTPSTLPGIAEGQNFGAGYITAPRYEVALGYTHVFTPSLTNEIHAGFGHSIEHIVPFESNTLGLPGQYGIPGIPQSAGNGGLPDINIYGYTGLGVAAYEPTLETVTDIEILDNVTKIYGSHALKMGGQVDDIYANIIQPPYAKGTFTFSGQYSDIPNSNSGYNGAADFLLTPQAATVPNGISNLGGVSSYGSSNYAEVKDRRYYIGAFFQDDWKVAPKLTLNLGLRWDHFTPYAEENGRQANFIADGGNGPTGTYYMSPQGCSVPRSSTFDQLLASSHIALNCTASSTTGTAQNLNFAPRIGFALRATNNLVVRGGYGIAYGALDNIGFGGTLGTNYPFEYTVSFNAVNSQTPLTTPSGATATIENALVGQNLQNPANVPGNGVGLFGRQFNFQTPYTQTFNFAVQDQFTKHDSVQVAYVGTTGRHLDSLGSTNSPSAILPPGTSIYDPAVPGHIPYPAFAPNSQFQSTNGSSSYNSMQTTYQHQLSIGLTLLANYTFAKCLTNQRTISGGSPGFRAEWLPGFGINGDYGLCDSDTAQVTHISGTYDLPVGRGEMFLNNDGRLTELLIGGWKTNFIFTHQSGQPFTVGCPQSTTSDFGCFANTLPGIGLYASNRGPNQWLNPAAFAQPPVAKVAGQLDYSPLGGVPNQVRGPGFSNTDFSIFKEFALLESLRLQLRAEAFNVFNDHSFGQPGNLNFQGSNFSQITYERNNARIGQFALKLIY